MTIDNKLNHTYLGKDLEAMSLASNYNQWIVDLLSPHFDKVVAEVGAGTGNLSKLILDKGIEELVSFEPSAEMHKLLLNNLEGKNNTHIINSMLSSEANNFQNYFDSILYVNVLEHIEDDGKELNLAYDCLKTGGHLCIFVPALSFLYSDFDKTIGHYRRYQKRQLIELVQRSRFTISTIKYIDILGIIPWYIIFVIMKQNLTSNTTRLYDKLCVPVIKVFESILPVPIGKNLLLVAKKI